MLEKLRNLSAIGSIALGIILLVLNLTKTCDPNHWTAAIIAYGFVIGPIFLITGIAGLICREKFEDENMDVPPKKKSLD